MNISTQAGLVILPPAQTAARAAFRNVECSTQRHDALFGEMQRLRGLTYLRDGAIRPDELTCDGRHAVAIDPVSWHILALDAAGRVCGCVRYLEEKAARGFDELWIRESAQAACPVWGERFRRAVEREVALARQKRVAFAEVGGWAVAEEKRGTREPLRMILAVWALSQMLGGCSGVATATVRHGSATMLRRIGLVSLTVGDDALPPYYDPYYQCRMEALRFDSDFPNPQYRNWIRELRGCLAAAPLVCRHAWEPAAERREHELPRLRVPLRPAAEVA